MDALYPLVMVFLLIKKYALLLNILIREKFSFHVKRSDYKKLRTITVRGRKSACKEERYVPILSGEERKKGWGEIMLTIHAHSLSTSKSLRRKPLSRKGVSVNLVNSSCIGEKSEEVCRTFLNLGDNCSRSALREAQPLQVTGKLRRC